MPKTANPRLRRIPAVERILADPAARACAAVHGRTALVAALRRTLDAVRAGIRAGDAPADLTPGVLLDRARELLAAAGRPGLGRAVNATGVLLHTGLGRAVLSPAALRAIADEQSGYSLLEVDRATGDRSTREAHVAALLRELTGAEAATVVNNNAGATLLALAAVAAGREVIVSRGQLVEIGGSFRIPDVLEAGGARLVEVGTTNRTYIADYERRINPATALLLRVHSSNYRILGFTHAASLPELVELGRRHRLPVMDDLGSGALADLSRYGVADEPVVGESVRAGADVVAFSGDKLLGGPQAGILIGKREIIGRIRAHPLFRALRPDKLTLTALEATLRLYRDPDRRWREIPTLRMIAATAAELDKPARELAAKLGALPGVEAEVVDDVSEVGGGSAPAREIPTRAVAVRLKKLSPDRLADRLRAHDPPVFARIRKDRVILDIRTLLEGEAEIVVRAIAAIH